MEQSITPSRENEIKLIINIPDYRDRRFGYLSNSSLYSFIIPDENIHWLSVEHFLIGKRFENTDLYAQISLAKNMAQVRALCRPKRVTTMDADGRISRGYIYGGGQPKVKDKKENEKAKWLFVAVQAKFNQNVSIRRKLLDTRGTTIVDPKDPSNATGEAIMKVRNDYLQKTLPGRGSEIAGLIEILKFDDVPSDVLTQEIKGIIDGILKIAMIIKDKEGLDRLYPEMFEDALYNIGLGDAHRVQLTTWIQEITKDWSQVIVKTPKFHTMFLNIEKYLSNKRLPGYGEKEYTSTALLLSAFIRWYRSDGPPGMGPSRPPGQGKMVVSNIFILRPGNITIPPKPRKYRTGLPSKVHRENLHEREIEFKDRYGDITITYPSGPSERTIILVMDDMELYRPQIVSTSGKITSPSTVEFHASKLTAVEDMIYNSLTSTTDRYDMVCRCWARRRISLIDDVRTSLVGISEKGLLDATKILGLKFLPYPVSSTTEDQLWSTFERKREDQLWSTFERKQESQNPPDYITSEFKDRKMPPTASRKLCHHLVPTTQAQKDRIMILIDPDHHDHPDHPRSGLGVAPLSEVMKTLDEICGWRQPVVQRKIDVGMLVCLSMDHILGSLSLGSEPAQRSLKKIWAFTILLPKDMREKAKLYIKTQLDKYRNLFHSSSVSEKYRNLFHNSIAKKDTSLSGSTDICDLDATLFSSTPANVDARIRADVIFTIAYSFIHDHIKKGLSTSRIIERCKLFGFNSTFSKQIPKQDVKKTKIRPETSSGEERKINLIEDKKVAAMKEEKFEGKVIECEGNLTTFTDAKWICVVANVTSLPGAHMPKKAGTKSEVTTREVYEKYPYANVYMTPDRKSAYTPGEILTSIPRDRSTGIQLSSTVDHRYVVTLFAEFAAGGPKKITDTKQARLEWFSASTNKLSTLVKERDTIAFSHKTLMEGYREFLITLSQKIGIVIYVLSETPTPPSTKLIEVAVVEVEKVIPTVPSTIDPGSKNKGDKLFSQVDWDDPHSMGTSSSRLGANEDDEISRGALYIKIFRAVMDTWSPGEYSRVVDTLEHMEISARTQWLKDYSTAKKEQKKNMLTKLVKK
jgi:hypothetical protein